MIYIRLILFYIGADLAIDHSLDTRIDAVLEVLPKSVPGLRKGGNQKVVLIPGETFFLVPLQELHTKN